jgi:hypothetical protein
MVKQIKLLASPELINFIHLYYNIACSAGPIDFSAEIIFFFKTLNLCSLFKLKDEA